MATSFKIFLTRSYEVAQTLYDGIKSTEYEVNNLSGVSVITVGRGPLHMCGDIIPKVYQEEGMYCTYIQYKSDDPKVLPEYEIVWA